LTLETPETELTPREREILHLARMGRTNNEIAEELGITRNAVRFHLKDIHSKLETGGQRSVLARGWAKGLALLTSPAAKLGVPATIAAFTTGIAVTGFAAYQSFPGDGANATAPKRFEGSVMVDGKYENGCPMEFNTGTMTLADFAYGKTTLDELRALNPDVPDGPLPPDTVIKVPYDSTKTCSELRPNMTPAGLSSGEGTPKAGG
jgi:DNA-binding CsgD family transcriptional regulator